MSSIINLNLGTFPTDSSKQALYMNQLLQNLKQFEVYVDAKTADMILLQQPSEPTQSEWEIAWLAQTGKSMPLSKGAVFTWWDTVNNCLGGCYGILLDDTVVRRKDPKYVRSGIVFKENTVVQAPVAAAAYLIGTNLVNHPVVTFTANQKVELEIEGVVPVTYNSGTGDIGMDFLLDGVKVGTTLFTLSDAQAIFNIPGSGVLSGTIVVPDVSAGAHTLQMIVGSLDNDATPANVDYASQTLLVKGYAL